MKNTPSLWQNLNAWELRVVRMLYVFSRNHSTWERPLYYYTRMGDGWIWIPVTLFCALYFPWNDFSRVLLEVGLSLFLTFRIYKRIKKRVARLRPYKQLNHKRPRVAPLDEFSFPSGHTMNNLAVSMALTYFHPLLGYGLGAMSLSWGLARVYFTVHFLSDVLAGLLLGLLCSWIAHQGVQGLLLLIAQH